MIVDDIRLGARMLVRRPGLSIIAVIALALGIGLTTTMFSIVYGFTLRGLPFEDPEQLVQVTGTRPSQNQPFTPVSIHDFEDWREQQSTFEGLAAYANVALNMSGSDGLPVRYEGQHASANFFHLLRVRPFIGRTFTAEEDHPSSPPVMILSYPVWQDRFGGDPDVLGRAVRANGELMTIVGVMPERFSFLGHIDAWMPLRIDPLALPRGSAPTNGGVYVILALGRLKESVSLEQARTEMTAIAGRLATEHHESNEGVGVRLTPYCLIARPSRMRSRRPSLVHAARS